jgi:ankyrin repeat protein
MTDINADFFQACVSGEIEVVKKLIQDEKLDINFVEASFGGLTPLSLACQFEYIDVVKCILKDERVDTRIVDNYGRSPFYIACKNGWTEIVELLMKDENIDVNRSNISGQSSLYIACLQGNFNMMKLLMKSEKIDVNKADTRGLTPFHVVCSKGHKEGIKFMLKDDRVNVNKCDINNETAFRIACKDSHHEVIKLLITDSRVNFFLIDRNLLQNEEIHNNVKKISNFGLNNHISFRYESKNSNDNVPKYSRKELVELLIFFSANKNLEGVVDNANQDRNIQLSAVKELVKRVKNLAYSSSGKVDAAIDEKLIPDTINALNTYKDDFVKIIGIDELEILQ